MVIALLATSSSHFPGGTDRSSLVTHQVHTRHVVALGKLSIMLNRLPDMPPFGFGKFFGPPRSREALEMTAFYHLLKEVFKG